MTPELHERIELLMERQPRVFGANFHGFVLNDPIADWQLDAFERRHCVKLPEDYRWFISRVGNGGAGPFYGVFPLGSMDDGHEIESWEQESFMVGALSEPFPHTQEWNDLSGAPDDSLIELDESAYESQLETFEERYFSPVNGAIPICHMGCALRIWLVVTGPERGHLWLDKRAARAGLQPISERSASSGPAVDRAKEFSGFLPRWFAVFLPSKRRESRPRIRRPCVP